MINPYYLKIKLNMSMYSVQEKDIIHLIIKTKFAHLYIVIAHCANTPPFSLLTNIELYEK